MKVPTLLTLTDFTIKWGLVTVMNEDTSTQREYMISADEVNKINRGSGAGPSGCSKEEWLSGRVFVTGRPCLQYQCVINPGGNMIANYGIVESANQVSVNIMQIPPSEYEISGNTVLLEESLAVEMGVAT